MFGLGKMNESQGKKSGNSQGTLLSKLAGNPDNCVQFVALRGAGGAHGIYLYRGVQPHFWVAASHK